MTNQKVIELVRIKDHLELLKFYASGSDFMSNRRSDLRCRMFALSDLGEKQLEALAGELNDAIAPVIKKYIAQLGIRIVEDCVVVEPQNSHS